MKRNGQVISAAQRRAKKLAQASVTLAASIQAAYTAFEAAGHSEETQRALVCESLWAAQRRFGRAGRWCYSRAARAALGMDPAAGDFLAREVQGWMPEDC